MEYKINVTSIIHTRLYINLSAWRGLYEYLDIIGVQRDQNYSVY